MSGERTSAEGAAAIRLRTAATPEDAHDQEAALAELRASSAVLSGHFALSAGKRSSVYVQCARVMEDPARGERICRALAAKIRRRRPELWADGLAPLCVSPALGAVIVGYETARALGARSLFVERKDGVFQLRRGFEIPRGAPCLMIEDVITTGKSSRECLETIRAMGGRPVAAACLVDRSGGAADLGLPLIALVEIDAPLYDVDQLPPELAALPVEKPGSRTMAGPTGQPEAKAGDGAGSEGD